MAVTLPEEIARAQLMVDSLTAICARRPNEWLQRDLARWQRRLARLEANGAETTEEGAA